MNVTVSADGEFPHIARIESGLDWITWSEPATKHAGWVYEVGMQLIEKQRQKGSQVRPWSFEGYRGSQCPGLAIGSRSGASLLRISGSLADTWSPLLRSAQGRPSRLDVQTSIWLTRGDGSFGNAFLSGKPASRARSRTRTRLHTTWSDSRGSWCGMVGRRTSRAYVRVYDKGVEQKALPPGIWWRYELEAKRDLAESLWQEWKMTGARAHWCYSACERSSAWQGLSWPLPTSGNVTALPPMPQQVPPDVEARLRWLRTVVKPVIGRLLPAVGTAKILEALDLDGYAWPMTDVPNEGES